MISQVENKIAEIASRIHFGVLPAMATPLNADGETINESGVESLVNFLIESGVKGLFIGGTTGEGILLDLEARMRLHESAFDVIDGRVPALIHIGANTLSRSIRLVVHAQDIGVDAIVAVTPYFYPIHEDALLQFYQSLAEAAPEIPLFAYDIPHLAQNSISPKLLPRLMESIPSFAGLKTSRADAQLIRSLVDAASGRAIVLAGNERIALGSLALGVDGLISGLSTAIPEPFISMVGCFAAGDYDGARTDQKRINRILDLMPGGARIGAIKTILAQRGIPAGPAIPPRPMPDENWPGWSLIKQEVASYQ
jgi:dihydrodipicolinate synthase/N-acetylneuraminate lyase